MVELSLLPLEAILEFSNKMLIFLAALAALIFVHELGHFLVARKVGVTVEKFSLGFGPKIIGIQHDNTDFIISAIPLGGYVKMKGEDPDEQLHDTEGSFSSAPVKDRLAIAFAGPAANILFALGIYLVVYLNGVPTMMATVGTVKDLSPAQVAGLQSGDRIIEIDGEKIEFWEQLQSIVHKNPGNRMDFTIERNTTEIISLPITPISEKVANLFGEKENVGLIGITPLVRNISFIREGSPSESSGLQVGDRILSIDGLPMRGWGDLKTLAIDKPGQELTFTIQREGIPQEFTLTPEAKTVKDEQGKEIEIGTLGLGMIGEMSLEQYGLLGATLRAIEETGRLTYLIVLTIKKMIFGSVPAESIGGPILIFQIYGEQAKQGFNELIRLTALISINLGLLNLLPIPILDGGHIFFFLIEIAKGRPVSQKNRERAQQVGFFMLISLMIFAFYNDIMRIIA
ncbi:MAG: RIP metalloprotease RseP [Nitrospinota bacterium]|nr:RIP metalloprotease RseP [Nitrospinota bacterium]